MLRGRGGAQTAVDGRRLVADLWRACLGVLLGVVVGIVFILPKSPDVFIPFPAIVLGSLVIAPISFVAFLLIYKSKTPRRSFARTFGVLAGLRLFVALYLNEGVSQPIYALRMAGPVVGLFSALALALIAGGLVASDFIWSLIPRVSGFSSSRHRGRRK